MRGTYQAVLESFKELQGIEDLVRKEFELVQAARSHKLPISSYRKMYAAWKAQQNQEGSK